VLELLWPSSCVGCDIRHQGPLCPRCTPGGLHRPPLSVEGVRWIGTTAGYDTGVGRALRRSKYAPDRSIAVRLADGFARALVPAFENAAIDLLIPAPASCESLLKRGFSIPALLTDRLSRVTGLPMVDALSLAPGARQAGLSLAQRAAAARSRTRVREDRVAALVGRRVLLIDDVITTGATAAACTKELLGSEVSWVGLATLCATRSRNGEASHGL
jgi:predicted amidophosphoribosyltransferase